MKAHMPGCRFIEIGIPDKSLILVSIIVNNEGIEKPAEIIGHGSIAAWNNVIDCRCMRKLSCRIVNVDQRRVLRCVVE